MLVPAAATVTFVAFASGFFVVIGEPPARTLWAMVVYAVGDAYSLSESLVKTTPILLSALAVALPARLGLISVGAEGQLYLGALTGTAVVLAIPGATVWLLLPAMLLAGAAGGAVWGGIPGLLKARFNVNETITTLLMNYIGILFVSAAVYGPWKDPGNLGWPATIEFPPAATVPHLFGTRVHLGLLFGLAAAVLMAVAVDRTRWGVGLAVMRSNLKVGGMVGLRFSRQAVVVMALGGALAGIAGISETSAIQGRLQPGISVGYGLTGFLVAWLCGHRPLLAVPVSFLVGGLITAGDALQLFNKVPAASSTVLQGLLFASVLGVAGVANARRRLDG